MIRTLCLLPLFLLVGMAFAQGRPKPFVQYTDSIGSYLRRIQQGDQEFAFAASGDINQWQTQARGKLIELIGLKRKRERLSDFQAEVTLGKSEAQKAAANRPELDGHVRFVSTTEFARPKEKSPNVGHGHHWFGNAESYILVGDALGKAMLELVD